MWYRLCKLWLAICKPRLGRVYLQAGPAVSFAERPNFDHDFRSATRGLTTSLCVVNRMRRVVFTFLPSSLNLQVIIVLVPSLFVVVVEGGRVSTVATVSSRSSSSAQSLFPCQNYCSAIVAGFWGNPYLFAAFDILRRCQSRRFRKGSLVVNR